MKRIFLLFVITLCGFYGNSQEVIFGAKAGLNLANIDGDFASELDARASFHLGVVAEVTLSDIFSIQPELLYSSQGSKYSYKDEFGREEEKYKLDYLNLPIIVKYYPTDGLSLEAGPQIGFNLNAKVEYDYNYDGFIESGEEDIDDIKEIDFGLNFGVGYKLDNGLNFGARYNLGLSNIIDDTDFEWNNSVFQFYVGYFFK
ncbi:porin family protein [Tamlana flava]|uniref:porin family protein n=1 Tax=Tamlana flava TaxID=3158572 RepID=UPI00351AC955